MTEYYINVAATGAIVASKLNMQIPGVQSFISGYMYSLLGKDDMSSIEQCLKTAPGAEGTIK